jgi:hypothetical protein
MSALTAARLLAVGSAWRLTGLDTAGRALVAAVTGSDPDGQVLAGILLTRAGDRSVPLIGDALDNAAAPGELANVLASIGTDAARTALETAAGSVHPDVAAAAGQALQTLDQLRGPGEPPG